MPDEPPLPPSPAGPGSLPAPPADPALSRYLAAAQLNELDLSGLELDALAPARLWPSMVLLLALAASAGGLIVLPTTSFYQLSGIGEGLYYALWATTVALAAGAARATYLAQRSRGGLWTRQANADGAVPLQGDDGDQSEFDFDDDGDAARSPSRALAHRQRQRRAAARRHRARAAMARGLRRLGAFVDGHPRAILGALVVTFAALLAFVLPHEAQWQGNTYSELWFLTVFVAVVTGVLVGRFIMAAGAQKRATVARPAAMPLPAWVRWATLALLAAGAILATVGPSLTSQSGVADDFSFASIGLVVGIGGAIWIARRFDEWEASLRSQAEAKRAAARDTSFTARDVEH